MRHRPTLLIDTYILENEWGAKMSAKGSQENQDQFTMQISVLLLLIVLTNRHRLHQRSKKIEKGRYWSNMTPSTAWNKEPNNQK
jgi:hypothetical protein